MIEIPGDMLEGGGQIIRTSISLAALTGEAVHLTKIRCKRPNPGLQPQHVTATKALATFCDAQTEGLTQGSTELSFRPREHRSGIFRFDVVGIDFSGNKPEVNLIQDAFQIDFD